MNSAQQESQPINISISSNANKETNNYNEFKEYIVINNIALQKEVKEANIKIKMLESDVEKQEDIQDKYDIRINYLKGLLKNLNELRNDYSYVSTKTENKQKLLQDLHKKNKKKYYEIYSLLIIINVITIIMPRTFINYFVLLLQTIIIIIIPYCCLKIKEKYATITNDSKEATNLFKEYTSQINKIKEEIKKTEDACISLDNWICET